MHPRRPRPRRPRGRARGMGSSRRRRADGPAGVHGGGRARCLGVGTGPVGGDTRSRSGFLRDAASTGCSRPKPEWPFGGLLDFREIDALADSDALRLGGVDPSSGAVRLEVRERSAIELRRPQAQPEALVAALRRELTGREEVESAYLVEATGPGRPTPDRLRGARSGCRSVRCGEGCRPSGPDSRAARRADRRVAALRRPREQPGRNDGSPLVGVHA